MSTHHLDDKDTTVEPWVNSAGERWHAGHQRLLRDLENVATTGSLADVTLQEPDGRTHRPDAHMPGVSETTQALLEEDWVDRHHSGQGRPLGPALVGLLAIFAWSLLAMGLVWLGARLLAGLLT